MGIVKFIVYFDNKADYYFLKNEVFKARATLLREKVRELKDEFAGEAEIITEGSFLYKLIKQSEKYTRIYLLPGSAEVAEDDA
jgi:hypothetical protein